MAIIGNLNTGSGILQNQTQPLKPGSPSVKHDIGQLFGHALNALPGYSTLGANITNPEVNYLGAPNPGFNTGTHAQPAADVNNTGTTTWQAAQDAAARAAAAKENALYGTYKTDANTALDKLRGAYNTQTAGINRQYDVQGNQLQSGYNSNQQKYQQNIDQQNQNLLRQDNQIRQGTSAAYNNLMNLLGAYGGGASSTALQWAPTAAQNFSNAQLNDANQNAATNIQSLNQNWGDYQHQYDDQKKQMQQKRADDLAQAQATYNDTRGRLQDIIKNINNRSVDASVLGDRVNTIADSIPSLQLAKMTYTGTVPTYQAPALSTFVADNAPAAAFSTTQPGSTAASPALTYLADQRRQNDNTPALAYLLNQQRRNDQVTPVV